MFFLFIAIGFGLMSLAHTAPFPFFLDAVAPATALWSMPERELAPMVYLTFDDGPNPTATPDLLDVLDRSSVRRLSIGSAPMTQGLFDNARALFPTCVITNGYGTTEVVAVLEDIRMV